MTHEGDGRIFVFVLVLVSLIILWEKHVKTVSSSVFALTLGMLVSVAWTSPLAGPADFAPELFLYLLLPPMLLRSSFNFEIKSLRSNWLASLTFAFAGTLFSVAWIAYGICVWCAWAGINISVSRALLCASVLAPTDTVATMSMTRSLHISDSYIFDVLENESVMNDAISVVLVRLFSQIDSSQSELDKWTPVSVVFWSLLTTFLSIVFGACCAIVKNYTSADSLTTHYLSALLVYAFAETCGLSGILGLFTYGAILSVPSSFEESLTSISTIVEAYVYLTLGLALHTYEWKNVMVSFLVFVSCVVGRVWMSFMFGCCLRYKSRENWSVKSMLFFSMCGVRGAISYALSMSLQNEFIRSTTFVVIVCTIFVFGTLQKCLLRMLLM